VPSKSSPFRSFVRNRRTDFLLHRQSILGMVINSVSTDYFPYPWSWFRSAQVSRTSRVLDIGCGGGAFLKCLYTNGFSNLNGIDGFLQNESSIPGINIRRLDVMDTSGQFDFIMLHHSFEHLPNPVGALLHITSLLAPNGTILIRTPVADCEAFHMFKENWFQIDAPRHLFIPSVPGMKKIADKVGLCIFMTDFDSTPSQFVVSEGYRLGLSMIEQKSIRYSHISADLGKTYSDLCQKVNALETGDQAAFLLKRK